MFVCLFVCLFWCCCFLTKKTIKRLNSHAAGSEKSEPFWHRVLNSGFFLSEDYRLYSIELAFGACGLGSGNGWSKYYEKHAENFPCEKRNVKMICLALLSNPLFIFFFFFLLFSLSTTVSSLRGFSGEETNGQNVMRNTQRIPRAKHWETDLVDAVESIIFHLDLHE